MSELLLKLQIYEGPLDLLLHLIKKNEVDLNDIPVALITAQYLEYLGLMESLNVEVASDFLVMAATLTQIKSRLLLPREDNGEDDQDPIEELKSTIIGPLLEHLRRGDNYQGVAQVLGLRQMLNSDVFVRSPANRQQFIELQNSANPAPTELVEASLFDLMEAFQRLVAKKKALGSIQFKVEPKTLEERLGEIQTVLKQKKRISFEIICSEDSNNEELILSFLAVLELGRVGFLRLYQNLDTSWEMTLFLSNPEAGLTAQDKLDY